MSEGREREVGGKRGREGEGERRRMRKRGRKGGDKTS